MKSDSKENMSMYKSLRGTCNSLPSAWAGVGWAVMAVMDGRWANVGPQHSAEGKSQGHTSVHPRAAARAEQRATRPEQSGQRQKSAPGWAHWGVGMKDKNKAAVQNRKKVVILLGSKGKGAGCGLWRQPQHWVWLTGEVKAKRCPAGCTEGASVKVKGPGP